MPSVWNVIPLAYSNSWTTGTTTTYPLTVAGSSVGSLMDTYVEPEKSKLDWLDDEIEQVCALARKVAA